MCGYQRFYKYACGEREQMGYTAAHESIVGSQNEVWLEDVSDDTFSVHCSFDAGSCEVKFYIRFRGVFEKDFDKTDKLKVLSKGGASPLSSTKSPWVSSSSSLLAKRTAAM